MFLFVVLQVLENSPQEQDIDESAVVKEEVVDSDHFSSEYEGSFLDDSSDDDSYSGSEVGFFISTFVFKAICTVFLGDVSFLHFSISSDMPSILHVAYAYNWLI